MSNRPSGRAPDQLRAVSIHRRFTRHAEGSVLVCFGDTRVLCTASVEERAPAWKKDSGGGWLTAEYGMLPRATHTRGKREASQGKQTGRTQEIQRLIGRALRSVLDLGALGNYTITIDCDVLQADGGTRTAAITGGYVALADAVEAMRKRGQIRTNPMHGQVAAVSVGIVRGMPMLDLGWVAGIVERHPRTPWILAGINYFHELRTAVSLMLRYPTVYLETSCIQGFHAIAKLVQECGSQQLLFGSCAPLQHARAGVDKILFAHITDADRERILSSNARELLRLDATA